MNIYLYVLLIYLISFITISLIEKLFLIAPTNDKRNASIDGLRGFLALGVFIHHTYIYFSYFKSGIWQHPSIYLFNQLGVTSVSLFFMITSYLFTWKFLNSDSIL